MRTQLRGLEIGGIQIGIERPETCAWDWPESEIADFICLPRDPQVHVGVRVGEIAQARLGGEVYALGAWTFEVARDGENWLLGLSRRGVREQLATFDADYRVGEVMISREVAQTGRFPLRTPIDEWVVIHQTVARGGLYLSGHAAPFEGRASIRLGVDAPRGSEIGQWRTPRSGLFGKDTVLLRDVAGGLRSFATPWSGERDSSLSDSARVADLIVVEPAERAYRESLDPDEAADLLVRNAVVPLSDEAMFDRVLANAKTIAEGVAMLRFGEPAETDGAPKSPATREATSAWQSKHLLHAFAVTALRF